MLKEGFSVKNIHNEKLWNNFVLKQTTETFHQSWEWGEVYQQTGCRVWRFALFSGNKISAVCLVIKIRARRGTFLLVPHGPIFNSQKRDEISQTMRVLHDRLLILGKKEKVGFIRVAPIIERSVENQNIFEKLGYRRSPIFIQSERSWVLDITNPEEILLKNMRKSTRNILKKENEYDLCIKYSLKRSNLRLFLGLYEKTVKNKGFVGQNPSFIKQEFYCFSKRNGVLLFFVYKNKALVGAAFIITQGKTAYYHYGASIRLQGGVPAPHILQWNIIKYLMKNGFERYNFWGISPKDKPHHPWVGLSVFKRGFGGEEHEYLQTQDYILRSSYWFNWIVETFRKIYRRY